VYVTSDANAYTGNMTRQSLLLESISPIKPLRQTIDFLLRN